MFSMPLWWACILGVGKGPVDVSRTRILVGLVIGIFCVSTAAIFIKLCDAPSLMIATYRLTLASLILTPYALHERRYRRINRENWPLLAASGVFLCLHFVTWIASLKYTSVASSVVLVTTMPVFCALISHFFGRPNHGPFGMGNRPRHGRHCDHLF